MSKIFANLKKAWRRVAAIRTTTAIDLRSVQQVGGDHMVVAAARVSTSGEAALAYADSSHAEGNAGLINYLVKSRHGTPLEHSSLTFFVHAPAFVWWEWVRHRIGHSFNIESSRYKEIEPVFWLPPADRPLLPAPNFKAARPEFAAASPRIHRLACWTMRAAYAVAYAAYSLLLWQGVAREVARTVLPFGIYFSGWVTVNPRSLMAFLSLRTRDEAARFPSYPQREIEEPARLAEAIFREGWPLTHAAFCRHGRVAP